ncbi:MAG TPA: GAF domain-containing protein [Candidatus Angelobacter sp.]
MATQPSYSPEPAPVTTADELAVIVQRAKTFTNASAAATAIREPNTNEFICRARSGPGAPDVGTVLRTEGTFTGMCIRNGEELLCDDARTDRRVDTSAVRALGIRSIAVVPIKEDATVSGVLAVFAPAACAFSSLHVATLNALADQISMLLRKERRSKTGGPGEPQVGRPDFAAHANASSQSFAKGPVALVARDTEAASASTQVLEPASPEAETSQVANGEMVPPIPVPETIETPHEKRAESTVFDSESRIRELQLACASPPGNTFEKQANSIAKKFIVTGATTVVLLAAFVTIGVLKIGSPPSETPTPDLNGENSSIVPAVSNQTASSPASKAKAYKVRTGSQSKRNQRPEKKEQPGKPADSRDRISL